MAIIIPSAKIYNKQNPKIRDNVIERIEIGATGVYANNTIKERVSVGTTDGFQVGGTKKNGVLRYIESTTGGIVGGSSHAIGAAFVEMETTYSNPLNISFTDIIEIQQLQESVKSNKLFSYLAKTNEK